MKQPLISVVMPVYNGERYLKEALQSIADQTFKDYEVVAVDDGSTDRSASILKNWPYLLRVLSLPHKGVTEALNAALSVAKGTFFAYIAADDIWLPNKLATEYAWIRAYPEASVIYSDFFQLFPNGEKRLIQCHDFDRALLKRKCFLNISSSLIRTEALRQLREQRGFIFNPKLKYCPDWELWQALAEQHSFKHVPEALSIYRLHPGQSSRSIRFFLEAWKHYTRQNGFNLAFSMNQARAAAKNLVKRQQP